MIVSKGVDYYSKTDLEEATERLFSTLKQRHVIKEMIHRLVDNVRTVYACSNESDPSHSLPERIIQILQASGGRMSSFYITKKIGVAPSLLASSITWLLHKGIIIRVGKESDSEARLAHHPHNKTYVYELCQ